MSEGDQDVSRRYWKAAISTLPTAEKRDAAWEFYVDKLAGTSAGDTLSGLILLLEANGAFLLSLPEKFHAELTQPITEQLAAMREELRVNVETQRATLRAADEANESMARANQQLANTTVDFANKVHAAARLIDTTALASQVCAELESSIVSPLRVALRDVPEQTKRIKAATEAAESSIKEWHELHFDGIVLNACLVTLGVAVLIFCLIWFSHR
jgi:hypothetical protein